MSEIYQKLEKICGSENVSNKELDLIVYNSDLASLPAVISKLYEIKPLVSQLDRLVEERSQR